MIKDCFIPRKNTYFAINTCNIPQSIKYMALDHFFCLVSEVKADNSRDRAIMACGCVNACVSVDRVLCDCSRTGGGQRSVLIGGRGLCRASAKSPQSPVCSFSLLNDTTS